MAKENPHWQVELPLEAQQRRETFARFGLAAYEAQCVERQLGILLATTLNPRFFQSSPEERDRFFDTEFAKTLGQMLTALRARTTLAPTLEPRLRQALELRNWLAHNYFGERADSILSWDGRERMISELQETADFLASVDVELTTISEQWLQRAGISKKKIEVEMEKYKRGEDA